MAFGGMKDLLPGHTGKVYHNLPVPKLVEMALIRGEGAITASGALQVVTGKYTGRSPDDKFIVETPELKDEIWWQNNKRISEKVFAGLYSKVVNYLKNKDVFVFEGCAGADSAYTLPVRVVNEFAWQNLFVHQLFIRPDAITPPDRPGFTILAAPGCTADPAVDGT